MAEQLFSPMWYRVADTRPRLKAQTQVRRQEYRDVIWYVLYDAISNKSHRLSWPAYVLINLLDGQTTVGEAWEQSAGELGDDLPAQGEVVQLLSALYQADLLHSDSQPDMDELQSRYETKKRQGYMQRFLNPMALRLPLFDPQPMLERVEGFTSHLFTRLGLYSWCAIVITGLATLAANWNEFMGGLADRVLAPDNLVLMALIYPFVKALHELGHACAVRKWGGEVHDIGLMFLVFMPVPYVDASASWAFRDKHHRMVVGAAGIIVELGLASLAIIAWSFMEPGIWRAAVYNVVFIGGVSTLLFNGNPLLKFDGYYVFSDWLEIPNLAKQANTYFAQQCKQKLLGLPADSRDWGDARQRRWLVFYAVGAFLYRIFISLTIALFVASSFFIIGLLLAVWALTMSLLLPAFKMLRYLASSPELRHRRGRVWGVSGATAGLAVALVAVIPLPHLSIAEGVVWVPETNYVRAGTGGFVERVYKTGSDMVQAGDIVIALHNPELHTRREIVEARLKARQAQYRALRVDDALEASIVNQEIVALTRELERVNLEIDQLQLTTPISGRLVLADEADLPGRYLKQGELAAYVLDGQELTVRVAVEQQDVADVRTKLRDVELRFASNKELVYKGRIAREVPGATRQLPSAALTESGGGQIANDPQAENPATAYRQMFLFDVAVDIDAGYLRSGERVYVRFDHGYASFFTQIYADVKDLFMRLANV